MYNPFSLSSKTILITGASSGIGRATAIECSRMGATCILTGRDEERLLETQSQLEGDGHRLFVANFEKEDEIQALVNLLPELDGCVSNAGVLGLTPILGLSSEKIDKMQRVNLNAPMMLIHYLAKGKKLRHKSSIVFTSSVAGVYRVSIGNAIYATTKCGIDAFMRTAALELAGKGIRCNSVNPGIIETKSLDNVAIDEEQKNANICRYPLKRYGKPEEVAYAIIYLLSDASAWVTGTELKIDGGLSLS